jgi:3-deoxy-D-manno-octulosonate 8-phosphate phosphatase (KDO 8-P phosphatase)
MTKKTDKLEISLLTMDVDGVMTDGGIIVHDDGSESKKFHVHDGAWLRIWRRQGLKTAVITGRQCHAVEHRMRGLEIDYVYQRAIDKLAAFEKLQADSGVPAHRIAYIGDDVMDLPVLRRVGFSAAVADSHPLVLDAVDYVTTRSGGRGAVQEMIEYLLKKMGLWDAAMQRYQT